MPTPPTLPNGQPIKERINVYGLPNAGKTHQYFTIAKWHQDLGSDARFYAINTDASFEVVYSNTDFSNLTNITWTDCVTFDDAFQAAKNYYGMLREQDWLCVDLQSHLWPLVQDEYARIRAKETGIDLDDLSELWITEGSTKKYPIEGWDWQTPNARYRSLTNNYVLRGPGHRFIISHEDSILTPSSNMQEDEIAKSNRELFKPIGVRPAGQKEDAGRWHTILHLTEAGIKQQTVATARDKWGYRRWMGKEMQGGKLRKGEELKDFFLDYLIGVAKWEM